jgi:hypothetical protein
MILPGLGGELGWMLGSAIGGMLTQKGQNGPRVSDLKLQGSTYGAMIPFLYGTMRVAGQIIWQTDLIEHKQKTGGKGGPTVTTYTYSASFALDLCQGPIGGVLRIWADSRLVYDPSTMNPGDFPFVLYLGDETQLPDPTIEAAEGVGNVPANRGVAYIVFTDFYLTNYGNRIPNFTFEVFTAGQPIPWRYSIFPGTPPTVWNNDNRAGNGGAGPQSASLEDGVLTLGWWTAHSGGSDVVSMPTTYEIQTFDLVGTPIDTPVSVSALAPAESTGNCITLNCYNNPHIGWARGTPVGFSSQQINAFYYDGTITASPIFDPTNSTNPSVIFYGIDSMPIYWESAVYATGGVGGAFISKWLAPSGAVTSGSTVAHYYLPSTHGGSSWTTKVDVVTGRIWCIKEHTNLAAYDEMYVFDTDLNVIISVPFAHWPANFKGVTGSYDIWNQILYFQGDSSNTAWAYKFDEVAGTFTLANEGGGGSLATFGGALGSFLYNGISLGNGLILIGNGIVSLQPRSGPILLSEIVADLSNKSGLSASEIDVSQLTDLVDGYVIASQGPTRGMITPLQISYFFDAVESDTVAKFVKRGAPPVVTISVNDLGTFASGSTPPPLATVMRAQEVDLPQFISAVYINVNADYQNGEQHSQRQVTQSELAVSLQLPISMDDTFAKSVADRNMFDAWIGRDKVTILTPRKYAYLEPTDVVSANGYTLRFKDKSETVPGVIQFDGITTATYVYTQSAVGGPGLAPPAPPPPAPMDTVALLLDLPLVTDVDNPYGWYAAMNGASASVWPGASLFKSIDGGATFAEEITDVVADTFGDCQSIIGDFGGGNIFDETNSLTVKLNVGSGTLSSATRISVLNGANLCAVGTVGTTGIRQIEVLQFRDAVLIAPLTYLLTGFLRGRRGTEWMIGAHVANEKFVLLPTSTNVLGHSGEIYLPRKYRAVTAGRTLATAGDIDFTDFAMANLCYAPTCLGGGRFPNQDLFLQWRRRTRIGGAWHDFVDVPLSQPTEQYTVDIYTNSSYATIVRTIITTTPSAIYSVAAQTADFGSAQSTVYWGVQQQGEFNLGTQARAVT